MLKRAFKVNSRNSVLKAVAGFGKAVNRLYKNRNHDSVSNGEAVVLKKLSKFNPGVIIDGGANSGEYTKLVSSLIPNCKIYAFEPVKDTFNKLQHNLKNVKNTFPINKGLFSENCSKEINIYSSDEHSSLYRLEGLSAKPSEILKVDFVKGDTFLEVNRIHKVDFLKLDLEGAEFNALIGFETALKDSKISAIQFEYGYINITTKKLLIDFYDLLKSFDYTIGKVYPKSVEFRNYNFKDEDFLGPNYIAVKRTEKDLLKSLELTNF